jgi:heme/copper-type cytochrome/quinol oxidase subunit 3
MSVETQSNPHHEHPDVVGSRNRLGVILLLVADVAMALSVLFVYFYLRQQNVNNMWLPLATADTPATHPISAKGAWIVTGLAALGLLSHFYGLMGARAKSQAQLTLGGSFAMAFSAAALVYQFMQISSAPFTTTSGAYASSYFLIAGLNTLHLVLTLFISLGNWNRSRLGLYASDHWHVDIVNIWWIWMTVSSLLGAFALSFT